MNAALLLTLLAAADPPMPLEAFFEPGGEEVAVLNVPAGWSVCDDQPRPAVEKVPPNGARIRRTPGEAARTTFLSWVRLRTADVGCHPVAVLAHPGARPIAATTTDGSSFKITFETPPELRDLREAPGLGVGARGELVDCKGPHCTWRYLLSTKHKAALSRSTSEASRLLQSTAFLDVAAEKSAAPVQQLRYAVSSQPPSLVLPGDWRYCEAVADTAPAARVKVPDGASTLEVRLTTEKTCADAQKQKLTRLVLVPALLAPDGKLEVTADDLALDWSPDAADRLSIFVRSRALVADDRLRARTSLVVGGHRGRWVLPCLAANDVCEYQVTAPVDWKSRTEVTLTFVFEGLDDLELDPLYAVGGSKLTSAAPLQVKRWLAPDFQSEEVITLPQLSQDDPKLSVRLANRLLRFAPDGPRSCEFPAGKSCGQLTILPVSEPAAAELSFNLTTADGKDLKTRLLKPKPEPVSLLLELSRGTLINPANWKPVESQKVRVTITRPDCAYEVRQLTQVWADTSDGKALYSAKPVGSSCAAVGGWSVATTEAGVELIRRVASETPGLFWVRFRALPSADVAVSAPLTFADPNGNPIPILGDATLDISASQNISVDVVRVRLRERYGLVGAAPPAELLDTRGGLTAEIDDAAPTAAVRAIALGRATWLKLALPLSEHWSWELESSTVRPCHATESSPRGRPLLPFREGLLCLVGKEDRAKEPILRGELKGQPSSFRLPAAAGLELPAAGYTVGFKRLKLDLEVRPVRLAMPLRDGGVFTCVYRGEAVEATHGSAVRAVRMLKYPLKGQHEDGCYAELGFVVSRQEANELKKRCGPDDDHDPLSQRNIERKNCLYARLAEKLEIYGPQRIVVGLSVSKKGAAFAPVKAAAVSPVTLSATSDLRTRTDRDVILDDDEPQGEEKDVGRPWLGLSVKLDFLNDSELSVEERDVVKLTMGHEKPGDYLATGDDERSRVEEFSALLRRAPENITGPLGLLFPASTGVFPRSGVGARAFATVLVPTGLLRTRNTGYAAKTSSAFDAWEAPAIGLALIYVLEWFDYNQDKAWSLLNPQLQVGLLSSSDFKDAAKPVRFSGIVGLGLRLPLGTSPSAPLEAGTGLSVWLEVTGGNVQPVQVNLLLGLSASLGAIGG